MQYVDNDMDDLFQRAAEHYPLRIDEGDWESIASRILPSTTSEKVAPSTGINKRILLTSFLVLFLSTSWLIFANDNRVKSNSFYKSLSNENSNNKSQKLAETNHLNNTNSQYSLHNSVEQKTTDKLSNASALSSSQTLGKRTPKTNKDSYLAKTIARSYNASKNSQNIIVEDKNNSFEKKIENLYGNEPDPNYNIAGITKALINDTLKSLKDDVKKDDIKSNKKNPKEDLKASSLHKKSVYVGVVAGADFNKVESGSFSHTGFDAGLLVGYRVNPRLSFESGVIRNNKNYNSQGKDFHMDKIRSSMPVGMVVDNLQSRSSLIEIPVKVKYDVIVKRKSNVFVGAGVSSYIMTKEKNKYAVTLNGVQSKFERVYTKNNYDVPAVANLSIGYEQSISNYLHLRIEPFLKIPLQGVGVGSLPITSAGVQVGIIGHLR